MSGSADTFRESEHKITSEPSRRMAHASITQFNTGGNRRKDPILFYHHL